MSYLSYNFVFKRLDKDGQVHEFHDTSTYYPNNPDYKWNEVSEPLRAAGYYGVTNGMHTLSFTLRNFVGRIYCQATLASNPTEDDWFNIKFCCCGKEYIQFDDQNVFNANGNLVIEYGTSGTFAESVVGNFTYLRVGVYRDYISENPDVPLMTRVGKLEEILINY